MDRRKKIHALAIFLCVALALFIAVILVETPEKHETIKEAMRDAVLHEDNRISLFGLEVNPALISGFTVTGVILLFALILRIFVIPRFRLKP